MDKLGIMQIKNPCVLIHIRTKGGVGNIKLVLALQYFLLTYSSLWLFVDLFVTCLFLYHTVISVSCSLVVTCWQMTDLLDFLFVMSSCVFTISPFSVLGQVWYLIVLISDLCLLPFTTQEKIHVWLKKKLF